MPSWDGGRPGRLVPAVGWLRALHGPALRADLIAGVTLAAHLLPAGLGEPRSPTCRRVPWRAGLVLVLLGCAVAAVVIALGG